MSDNPNSVLAFLKKSTVLPIRLHQWLLELSSRCAAHIAQDQAGKEGLDRGKCHEAAHNKCRDLINDVQVDEFDQDRNEESDRKEH